MLLLALAAAAQLSAPQGTDIRTVFSDRDMPLEYMPSEGDLSVGVRLTVRPDGKVQGCEIEYPSGLDRLDLHTCKIVKRRARYAPASAQRGTPAYAVYRTTVRWVVTGFATPRRLEYPADLTLTVNQLPAGVESPLVVGLTFAVDEQGRASSCAAQPLPSRAKPYDPEIVNLACDQLAKTYVAIPAKDDSGKPVRSVQTGTVAFSTR